MTNLVEHIVTTLCEKYGYDSVSVTTRDECVMDNVSPMRTITSWVIDARDEFQNNVSYEHQCGNKCEYFYSEEELEKWEERYETRNMRELGVLAAQTNNTKLIGEQLVTAQAQKFAAEIIEQALNVSNMLTDQRSKSA